jgi:hypothetical protein
MPVRRLRRGRGAGVAVAAALLASLGATRARAQDTCADAYEGAQERRRSHELSRARADLRLCERACPKKLAEDCSGWRREVEAELGSVVLDARDADGRALGRVRASADGAPLVEALSPDPVDLDPGPHVIVFEDEAGARVRVEITLAPGEKGRRVSATFPRPPPPVAPPPPPPPPPRSHSPVSYVLGAVGLAGLGVGAILGIKGQVEKAALEQSCAPRCNKATQVDPIAAEWWGGAAGAIAGGALLAAGVAVWIGEAQARGPGPQARVVLSPAPGGIRVLGTF